MKPITPRFSVVIPAYNASATLSRSVDSVLAQNWPAHEIIVVDDGSTDNSAEVLSRYGERIALLRQENAGPSSARNRGVEMASGEWIAFLDADDWYYPGRLQSHAEMIMENPSLDFLVAGYDFQDAEGKLIEASIDRTLLGRRLLNQVGKGGRVTIEGDAIGEFISEQFSDTRCLSLPRRTFIELGGFPVDLSICEDLVFMIRLCIASLRIGVSCGSEAAYYVHDGSLIRADRLRSQTETVRALHTLEIEILKAPAPILAAWQKLVKEAYRDLAYLLVKRGRRSEAIVSILRSIRFNPSWQDGRDILSVLRG